MTTSYFLALVATTGFALLPRRPWLLRPAAVLGWVVTWWDGQWTADWYDSLGLTVVVALLFAACTDDAAARGGRLEPTLRSPCDRR